MAGHISDQRSNYQIENAGLVLLYPFLPSLFNNLFLLESNRFKSIRAATKALFLLDYLVFGTHFSTGNNLLLNKILCNIPIETKIEYSIVPTIGEKRECDEMLKSFLNCLTALKNVSIDGFRQSFLNRSGEIQLEDNAILRIENLSIDIILTSLYWSLSIIKLPWMQHVLTVEWV